ncbi:MAG: hypothetical protein OEN23_15145 [Paracoccaceae bacterium]|nr:hypothetical protein [Paracoccaceae bacterium]
MFTRPSMVTRIAVGKTVGFFFGLIGFLMMPYMLPEAGQMLAWGFLLWYTTLGAIVAIFGVFDFHPILRLPMPWWFRAPLLGAWMNFVLTLLIYDQLAAFGLALFGAEGVFTSPFWFVAEGAVVGLVIGFAATRLGGEGPETAGR